MAENKSTEEYIEIQQQLEEYSHKIGKEWKKFGLSLGLFWTQLYQINASNRLELNDAIFKMLDAWYTKCACSKEEVMTKLKKTHTSVRTKGAFTWETADIDDDAFLYQVGEEVGATKWKELAQVLNVPRFKVDNCERNNDLNVSDAIMDMLVEWRSSSPNKSECLPQLRFALEKIKLPDVASKVSQNIRANPKLCIKLDKLQPEPKADESQVQLPAGKGTFYKARCKHDEVFVKIIHQGSALPEDCTKHLSREAQCMQYLRHEHTMNILYLLVDDVAQQYGVVMHYMPNGSLADLLSAAEIAEWKVKMQILLDICRGMDYLHDQPIVHTNLKPSNILLDKDFRGKISGFERAKFIEATVSSGTSNFHDRRSMYSSPEILREDPQDKEKKYQEGKQERKIDLPSDAFSFGIIAFDVAAEKQRHQTENKNRRLPFDATLSPQDLSYHYTHIVPRNPIPDEQVKGKIGDDCPPELITLIRGCCKIKMQDRYTYGDLLKKVKDVFDRTPAEKGKKPEGW